MYTRLYSTAKTCAECGTNNAMEALQCAKCNRLQPLPSDVDFYEVLGIPLDSIGARGWRVQDGDLKAQWRRTMAVAHPDRLVSKPGDEQEIGAQQSTIVNKAYETLRQPLQRALYLLQRVGGVNIEEDQSIQDPSFLMEVLELQEALENAQDQATVDEINATNQEHMQGVLQALDEAFAANPLDTDRIRDLAMQLRYWTNIEKSIREWQPSA